MRLKKCTKKLTEGGNPLWQKGTILIEFAFTVPIFIMLLLYIHDLVKIAKIKKNLSFSAECAVNMLQNISQLRSDKKITRKDYDYISAAAFLSYDGGNLDHFGSYSSENIIIPAVQMSIYYLKGCENNTAKIMWACIPFGAPVPTQSRGEIVTSGTIKQWVNGAQWKIGQEYDVQHLHPQLNIKKDEVKILLDLYLNSSWCYGTTNKDKEHPSTWGLFLHNPKATSFGSNTGGWFHTYIIFAPRPGLFNETPPQ
ncbi:MAG: hypothetical protein E7015_02290 [Alphaproteobacteria bacterium]|nr:hypothetical protein [Alphaproteobacteria bacterium]